MLFVIRNFHAEENVYINYDHWDDAQYRELKIDTALAGQSGQAGHFLVCIACTVFVGICPECYVCC